MAPPDKINLAFRWEFNPVQNPRDGSIRWNWRAYTQTGQQAMQSQGTFETLTECMNDAREHGYGTRR
jgi:hypothetical protein